MSAKKLHPQADYLLDILVAAGHITHEKAFQARDIALEFRPAGAPGAPQEAAAVSAVGQDAVDARRWRYAIAIGGNQRMNWMDVYDDWDGDGDFTDAIDAALAGGNGGEG